MSLTRELAVLTSTIDESSLQQEDIDATQQLLLDHLGCAANGSTTESAIVAQRWAAGIGALGSPLPVIGTPEMLPGLQASLANAVASHSIEYDDVHNAGSLHPAVVVFPAAFAAASLNGAEPEKLLVAVVRGYEVMCRVGRAAYPPGHYARNFHPTATAGTFGAAAAAGYILDLDETQLVQALGLAATMASGSMQFLVDGSWTKRLHPAMAARDGIDAAMLAAAGYVGGDDGIGGPRGFLRSYSSEPHEDLLLADWGTSPREVVNTSIKAHTCCRYKQGPIDALLKIRQEHQVLPADVTEIVIGLPSTAMEIVAEPHDEKVRPMSVVDAQFSMPFGAALALTHGRAGLDEYVESMLGDPAIVELMGVTHCQADPEIDKYYPEEWRAWARVTTKSGSVFEARVDSPKGDPANPFTPEELRAKFDVITGHCWGAEQQQLVAEACNAFGAPGSFAALLDALTIA